MFVRNMQDEKLRHFMRFITRSCVYIMPIIRITFNSLGLARRPIAHVRLFLGIADNPTPTMTTFEGSFYLHEWTLKTNFHGAWMHCILGWQFEYTTIIYHLSLIMSVVNFKG